MTAEDQESRAEHLKIESISAGRHLHKPFTPPLPAPPSSCNFGPTSCNFGGTKCKLGGTKRKLGGTKRKLGGTKRKLAVSCAILEVPNANLPSRVPFWRYQMQTCRLVCHFGGAKCKLAVSCVILELPNAKLPFCVPFGAAKCNHAAVRCNFRQDPFQSRHKAVLAQERLSQGQPVNS